MVLKKFTKCPEGIEVSPSNFAMVYVQISSGC